ncbi:MAG: type I DNA topoisomerase [Spirochaetales bacterium]|nr:type I DNA topoisomerase [Spirochaetales bacterium]
MGKSLVIVESPAKAKTINKYLGSDFTVKSSIGHIRDLPKSGTKSKTGVDPKVRAQTAALTRKMAPEEKAAFRKKRANENLVKQMGIDPDNGWKAQYEILPGKEKVVQDLKKAALTADTIFLATDLDREGEAIAWHLMEAIGGNPEKYKRVTFNEITKKAVKKAFEAPGSLDMDRVFAQQTRRFLDRVVGYMLSPLLWAKVARGLSAGRVQSVAVRLLVERERAIRSFIPEEYWEIHADLSAKKGEEVRFQVKKEDGKTFRPCTKEEADKAVEALTDAVYKVVKREDKPTTSRPFAPFITSTLQQAASTRLGFRVKKTMMLAQRLYESGHITYMRTDSTALSADAVSQCREYIGKIFGDRYLPEKPKVYTSKETAQEAHEAIRPSDVFAQPGGISGLERDAMRLYELIWKQFVACQMPPAEFTSTSIVLEADRFELRTRGRVVRFDGFMKVLPPAVKSEEDGTLPDLKVGDILDLITLDPKQHFTKPLPRFSEAMLVKELEKRGIGRPSTYASIISTIQDRGYVTLQGRRFYAEKLGDIVTDRLVENFTDLLSYGFTAGMEKNLDDVANGHADWKEVLNSFYKEFSDLLETAYDERKGIRPNNPIDTDISCPNCGRFMQIRTASTGVFLGCSGYRLSPKERCKQTINLIHGDEIVHIEDDDEEESRILRRKHRCPVCGTVMDSYLIDEERKLHVCGNNPDCPGFEVETGSFRIKGYDGPTLECDKCGSEMQLRTGRFGKYFKCTNETCGNTRKLLRNGEPAPPKMDPVPLPELKCQKVEDYYLLRDGAAGLFLAASEFPKNRETRTPLLAEILPHKDEIDPKYGYLFTGPVEDGDGNKTLIRFLRKTKEQYLMTEKEGKPTGWRAHYVNGGWVIREPGKK